MAPPTRGAGVLKQTKKKGTNRKKTTPGFPLVTGWKTTTTTTTTTATTKKCNETVQNESNVYAVEPKTEIKEGESYLRTRWFFVFKEKEKKTGKKWYENRLKCGY